jgi:DNA-binding CsgD family transcriptional regulator
MGLRLRERDVELRMATELLCNARECRGGALFFTGDAGLGKTALLQRIARDAASSFRVGSAVGDPVETSVAFGFLGQAIYELGCPVPLAEATETVSNASDARSARFHGVLRWLREISEPTVLTLDDAHWADSDSLALLSFLCRRLTGLPVAVVATLRSWPPCARNVVRRLQFAGHARLAELSPLSARAAEKVLTSQLRGEPDASTISRAIVICSGNPMLLEQVSVLIDRGDDLSSPRLSRELPDPQLLMLSRFAALPEEVIRCARAASVLGARFRPQLAAQIARTPEEHIEQTLDALVRSGLIHEVSGHLAEFAHPFFGQLLYDDLGATMRDQLHHRACRVLLDQGLEQEAAQHAMHADITGDPEITGVLERVGLEALRQGAIGSAIEHLRAAVTRAGHRASRTALTGLGEALLAGGQFREAIACCERLVDMRGERPGERAEALMVHATGLAQSGRLDEACDRLEEAVAVARETDLPLAVDAETERGYCRWWLTGPAAAVPILARARDMAGEASCRSGSRASAMWGLATLQAGDPAGFTEVAAASQGVLAVPEAHLRDFTTTWGTLASFAVSAMLTERFTEAEQAYTTALGVAERSGASLTAGVLGLNVSYAALLLRLGRLNEALHLTSGVLDLADVMPALAVNASVIHAEILLHLGRLEESSAWLSRAESVPAFHNAWEPMLRLHGVRGHYALRTGNWQNASERFLAAEELSESAGVGEPCFSMQARHAVLAHLRADRPSDAERVLGKLDTRAATLSCRWPRIAAFSARAELAELADDTHTANAAYTEALSLHAGLTLPLERIETLLEFGTFLRRAKACARARPLLAEAIRAAEAAGADWLGAQAHRELIASGGRRRRRGDTTGRLTPQELRVFELAAQGLSNKAMAGQLRVSPGTVKTHLEHIYAKLAVHSRRELILHHEDFKT